MASASLGAAAVHFGVMGDHLEQSLVFGLFFAGVAWGQTLWSLGMFVSPGRHLIPAGLVGNVAVVAVWMLSRTTGLPVGPEAWAAEALGAVDVLATMLELVVVIGCAVLLVRSGDHFAGARMGALPAAALGLALVLVTSTAIAVDGHTDGASHDHAEAPAADAHREHGLVGGSGEPNMMQIDLIREAMEPYEDVKVAMADGWTKEHPDWPEVGAHFYHASDWDSSFPADPQIDIEDPEFLMYSRFLSDSGRWQLVAVAYVADQARYPEPPTDLTGALYHEHVWDCIVDGEELEEEDWGVLSMEECEIMGGEWSPGGVWMAHVWLIDNPNGIFAETNPTLTAVR